MPTATRTKREAVCEFVASAGGSPLAGLMAIDDGRTRALYAIAEVPAEAGGRAFLLKKCGSDDGYRMECTHGGIGLSCECAGWVYRGACRHTTHVGRLVFAGRL